MNIFNYFLAIKKALESINGVKTLRIGLEPNLSPSDYPIIRIVAGSNSLADTFDLWAVDVRFSVYFGAQINEKNGIEEVYKKLYDLENQIRNKLHNLQFPYDASKEFGGGIVKFISTSDDGDTLKGFKILVSEYEIEGGRI